MDLLLKWSHMYLYLHQEISIHRFSQLFKSHKKYRKVWRQVLFACLNPFRCSVQFYIYAGLHFHITGASILYHDAPMLSIKSSASQRNVGHWPEEQSTISLRIKLFWGLGINQPSWNPMIGKMMIRWKNEHGNMINA